MEWRVAVLIPRGLLVRGHGVECFDEPAGTAEKAEGIIRVPTAEGVFGCQDQAREGAKGHGVGEGMVVGLHVRTQ